jgi:hypothetical protein
MGGHVDAEVAGQVMGSGHCNRPLVAAQQRAENNAQRIPGAGITAGTVDKISFIFNAMW